MDTDTTGQVKKRGRPAKQPSGNNFDNAISIDGGGTEIHGMDGEDERDDDSIAEAGNDAPGGIGDTILGEVTEPRKRGRPPASGGGSKEKRPPRYKETVAVTTQGIEVVLLNIHSMLAALTKTPEFSISKEEAQALSHGIAGVAKFYPTVGIDPKWAAWGVLALAVFKIYTPKIKVVMEKAKAAKHEIKTTNG